jgi:hypothetical protein
MATPEHCGCLPNCEGNKKHRKGGTCRPRELPDCNTSLQDKGWQQKQHHDRCYRQRALIQADEVIARRKSTGF